MVISRKLIFRMPLARASALTTTLLAGWLLAACTVVPQERVIYRESDDYPAEVYRSDPGVVIIERGPIYRSPPVYITPAPLPYYGNRYPDRNRYGGAYRDGFRDGDRNGNRYGGSRDDRRNRGGATYTGPSGPRGQTPGNGGGSTGAAPDRTPGFQPSAPRLSDKRSLNERPGVPRGVSPAPAARPAPGRDLQRNNNAVDSQRGSTQPGRGREGRDGGY